VQARIVQVGTLPGHGWARLGTAASAHGAAGRSCGVAALASQRQTGLSRTLPAHKPSASRFGELAPVVHEEAT
jgi:hypothetical protein